MLRRRRELRKLRQVARLLRALEDCEPRMASPSRTQRATLGRTA